MFVIPLIQEIIYDGPISEVKKFKEIYENFVYLLKDEKILKLSITLDKQIIKQNITRLINYLDEDKFQIVDEKTMNNLKFPVEMEFVGKYKLNKRKKTNNYKIPSNLCNECDLFYYLNSMNSRVGLKSEDLWNLSQEKRYYEENEEDISKVWLRVIDEIVSNLNIEIIDEYDFNKLSQSMDYIEEVRNKEQLWSLINLKKLKKIIFESKGNIEIFNGLNLNIEIEEEKKKIK